MEQLTEEQIQKKVMLKAARAAVRLRKSLEADVEIYRRLPEMGRRIDGNIGEQKPLALSFAEIFTEFGEDHRGDSVLPVNEKHVEAVGEPQ